MPGSLGQARGRRDPSVDNDGLVLWPGVPGNRTQQCMASTFRSGLETQEMEVEISPVGGTDNNACAHLFCVQR